MGEACNAASPRKEEETEQGPSEVLGFAGSIEEDSIE
jgi:hypothetical protein